MKTTILTEYNRIEKKLVRITYKTEKAKRREKPVAKVINLYSKTGSKRAA